MRVLAIAAMLAAALSLGGGEVRAYNTPCSGKKGGVSHCYAGKFICRDGSMSASKRTCSRP